MSQVVYTQILDMGLASPQSAAVGERERGALQLKPPYIQVLLSRCETAIIDNLVIKITSRGDICKEN